MKKVLLFALVAILALGVGAGTGSSQVKSYYSGDAVVYRDQLIVGSTNSDSLELFKLQGDDLLKFASVKPFNSRFNRYDAFYDLKFNLEADRLYVYAISGYSLYKYDISDLASASLVKKNTNNYWEWYTRVDKFGNNIVTVSAAGVKVYSNDLEAVDSYNVKNDAPYNIRSNNSDDYIFNIKKDAIEVYSRANRNVEKTLVVNYNSALGNRNLFYSPYDGMVYVVDDNSAKRIDLRNGALKSRFEHSGNPGYDVASSGNGDIFFSNGLGVVKLDQETMKLLGSRRTGSIAGSEGWAMGLRVVANTGGDKVVIFNNSSIVVLSGDLKLLASVRAHEGNDILAATENLYLRSSINAGLTDSKMILSGGGFFPNEKLSIAFGQIMTSSKADANGRFRQELSVPRVSAAVWQQAEADSFIKNGTSTPVAATENVEVKVVGEQSLFHYDTAFTITTTN